MSYGEFRAVLTLRALVHQPQVLILDEPFDGLDAPAKSRFSEALDQVSRNGTRLIIVTHHPGDLPACITHALLLDKGRILCQGEWKAVQAHPDAQLWFASDRS
jgi:molybdate transport system ATP-binding protein